MNSFWISRAEYQPVFLIFRRMEITVYSDIFTQPRKKPWLLSIELFSAREKITRIQNILYTREGRIHADLHVHLSDWISHNFFYCEQNLPILMWFSKILGNLGNFQRILNLFWIYRKKYQPILRWLQLILPNREKKAWLYVEYFSAGEKLPHIKKYYSIDRVRVMPTYTFIYQIWSHFKLMEIRQNTYTTTVSLCKNKSSE
jgi:hypothetical protein